eukprot:4813569-Pyramimonas_sp.AAC.1
MGGEVGIVSRDRPFWHSYRPAATDTLNQKCSYNVSRSARSVLRTFSGGRIGEPGRFATA